MRFIVFLFVLACFGLHAYYLTQGEAILSAIYNIGALIISSVMACTSDRR